MRCEDLTTADTSQDDSTSCNVSDLFSFGCYLRKMSKIMFNILMLIRLILKPQCLMGTHPVTVD